MYVRIEFENLPEATIEVKDEEEGKLVLDSIDSVFVRRELVSAVLIAECSYCGDENRFDLLSEGKGECPPCAADDSFHEDWRAECQ